MPLQTLVHSYEAITLEYVEFPANTHVYALQLQRDFKSLFERFTLYLYLFGDFEMTGTPT